MNHPSDGRRIEGRKPTLIRIPGTDQHPRARLVAGLLHGNEDSGYRAVLEMLRTGEISPDEMVRLAADTYHVVSRYGAVNAQTRADVEVKAGKLTFAVKNEGQTTHGLAIVKAPAKAPVPTAVQRDAGALLRRRQGWRGILARGCGTGDGT